MAPQRCVSRLMNSTKTNALREDKVLNNAPYNYAASTDSQSHNPFSKANMDLKKTNLLIHQILSLNALQ